MSADNLIDRFMDMFNLEVLGGDADGIRLDWDQVESLVENQELLRRILAVEGTDSSELRARPEAGIAIRRNQDVVMSLQSERAALVAAGEALAAAADIYRTSLQSPAPTRWMVAGDLKVAIAEWERVSGSSGKGEQ